METMGEMIEEVRVNWNKTNQTFDLRSMFRSFVRKIVTGYDYSFWFENSEPTIVINGIKYFLENWNKLFIVFYNVRRDNKFLVK